MRKIHITESQLEELKKKLTEDQTELATDPQQLKANPKDAISKAFTTAASNGIKNNVEVAIPKETAQQAGITTNESKHYTKKQIKEAKLRFLRENSVVFKKSDLS